MNDELKPIVEKVLGSGLIDKAMTSMLEQMGMLPSGSTGLVKEDRLKDATEKIITGIAEELAVAIEKEHIIKETALDLSRIRWPAYITISNSDLNPIVEDLAVMMDNTSRRYYIRIQDASEDMFVPGYVIQRKMDFKRISTEVIVESQKLYIGDKSICFQISTKLLDAE